ncbi:MAG: hypothetical protein Q9183_007131, partial [Haloplaca sp. 2 TL-2023]
MDVAGIMQSTVRPRVTKPVPRKPQANHNVANKASARQHLHNNVSSKPTAVSARNAVHPVSAASRSDVDTLVNTRTNILRKNHNS